MTRTLTYTWHETRDLLHYGTFAKGQTFEINDSRAQSEGYDDAAAMAAHLLETFPLFLKDTTPKPDAKPAAKD